MVDMKKMLKMQAEASLKISDALSPLNRETAPFYIMMLQGYVEMMEELYPGSSLIADALKLAMDEHKIVIKMEENKNGPHSYSCEGPGQK